MILKIYKMSGLGQSTPLFYQKDTKTSFLAGTYSPYGIRTPCYRREKGGVLTP